MVPFENSWKFISIFMASKVTSDSFHTMLDVFLSHTTYHVGIIPHAIKPNSSALYKLLMVIVPSYQEVSYLGNFEHSIRMTAKYLNNLLE